MNDFMDEARQSAAQCWCQESTSHLTMNPVLANEFARCLAGWMQTAAQHARNEGFYRNLLVQCAGYLGPEVFVSDDGSVNDSPLVLKVPELVKKLAFEVST